MISLNEAVAQVLEAYPDELVFVFQHPTDGLAVVVRDPLDGDTGNSRSYSRINFPIGLLISEDIRTRGVLAPLYDAALSIDVTAEGCFGSYPLSGNLVDIADIVRAFYFLQSRE